MGRTIGAAGRKYGLGRVAALTKAINMENLAENQEDYFIRMFKNIILWSKSDMYTGNFQGGYSARTSIAIFKQQRNNPLTEFDERLRELLNGMGQAVTFVDPWHEANVFTGNNSNNKYGTILLIPSYNALDGTRMPDAVQRQVLHDVYNYGTGLVIAEWFHLLNSLPNKRSFSYDDPSSQSLIPGLEPDVDSRVEGLIDASPFVAEDNIVFSDADEIVYTVEDINDDTSHAISPIFTITNTVLDTPFRGHISQLGTAKDDAIIFWETDLPAEGTTTTTTTTTTTSIPYDDIKLKVGKFYLENVCGPQKLYLSGEDKDFFLMENNDLFLIRNIEEPVELNFDIVAEDYFESKRFSTVLEHVTINLIECDKPITLPKNGSRPAYSWRDPNGYEQRWGQNAPSNVISPYEEYSFEGQGLIDKPAIVCLGGQHSDDNVFWMQINEGGTYTVKFDTDLAITDCVSMYLITNTPSTNTHPVQHEEFFNSWRSNPLIHEDGTNHIIRLFEFGSPSNNPNWGKTCGQSEVSYTFNVDQPMAVDPENQNVLITGEAYLVFGLMKNRYVTEHSDTACATITFGTTTTAPPPEYDFVVFVQNNAADVEVTSNGSDNLTAFKFTSIATTNPIDNVETFYISTVQSNTVFDQLLVSEDSEYITINTRQSTDSSRTIDVTLTEMPTNGGQAVINITGSSVTTTPAPTTPPPPTYPLTVSINDTLDNVYLDAYEKDYELTEGWHTVQFFWYTNSGFEYRPSTAATANPYEYKDRPTIDLVINETVIGMVELPSPTPASGGQNTISVGRGTNFGNNNQNTTGRIYIPVDVPVLGGSVELRLGGSEPVPTTTTTTTTTLPPCDDTIYIVCRQVLNCAEDSDGECVPQPSSYQEVLFSTCCPLSDAEVLEIVKDHNNASTTNLNAIYASSCPSSNFDLLAPCFAKDVNGNCQQSIHSEIIDTIICLSSENPLP